MQSIDSTESYAYGEKKEIWCNNIIKQYIKEHNPKWQPISDHWQFFKLLSLESIHKTNYRNHHEFHWPLIQWNQFPN